MVERAPACMEIAAGEYGYDPSYFRRMLEARAVDVLQADATRCGGITGFLMAECWPTPGACRCRRTPRPRCTVTSAASARASGMSNISTIMPALSRCCSRAR